MLDVALIGGGLCGLALAHSLHARGLDWALFEARPRLGGRVLGTPHDTGLSIDLGPTWYWPATQPSITRLIDDLGLPSVAQADDGRVWLLDDAGQPPRGVAFNPALGRPDENCAPQPGALHGGARRLAGGMGALTDALAKRLPGARLHTGRALRRLVDRGDHVELHFGGGSQPALLQRARRVVLALPPRLALELIRFEPELPAELQAAMADTPTWMASAAKAALPCAQAAWHQQGQAGNAWVTHPQAVLAESWDAGSADTPALAGFIALPASQRAPFARSLPVLLDSQVAMLWGAAAQPQQATVQDWADEPFTCSAADRAEDGRGGHPSYGDAALQGAQWQHKLWFGGSETARQGGGYLEGALGAAARLRRDLAPALAHSAD
ncbi:monoamine oxidase [Burkholderiales bacterium JOSHI_001]|nr:monoamine oxidase [Burkholderiales bacterium JOSHI_001]